MLNRFGDLRSYACLLLLAAMGWGSTAMLLRSDGYWRKPDAISPYVRRFQAIRQSLPPKGVVGYLTDENLKDYRLLMGFILTQYALAPVVIVRETTQDCVIGNFHEGPPSPRYLKRFGLVVLQDYGNGVMRLGRAGGG